MKQIKKNATKRALTPFEKKRLLEKNAKSMSGKLTKPERNFEKLMKEMSIEYETQKILGGFIYDFCLPEYRMFIEIDGDYYHGNPDKYSKDELSGMQKKNILNDKKKDIQAKGSGYKLERVWEHDINKEYNSVKMKFTKLLFA